jgi:hypothetical protein
VKAGGKLVIKKRIYKSKFMEIADKKLQYDLIKLNKMLKDINYCLIGGIAVKEYGYNRTTDDIDILVKKSDEQKLYNIFKTYKLTNIKIGDLGVDVIFSGERITKNGLNYPNPVDVEEIHNGLPFIDLKTLIIYKIDSGRFKDLSDVVELIKVNKLQKNYLDNLKYRELYNISTQEN